MDSPECWVTLGILAATTKKIRFGPLVSPIGFRNPVLLSRMACNVHSYSHGRLVLGVGAGWYADEYRAHGYEFPKFRVRYEQFVEALKIIKPLIEGKKVDFHGKYYSAKTICYPLSGSKVHLIIGGKDSRILRAAGKFADEWNVTDIRAAAFRDIKKRVDDSKGSRKIEYSRMGSFLIAENRNQLEAKLKKRPELSKIYGSIKVDELKQLGVLCGTVDELTSQLNELSEAGVDKFYFQILDTGDKEMVDLLTDTLKKL
jgi:alkanesulfonate monooxygenase SsuD/methylene tetrahydromethanopterin reductase-like flavin-dependent oxidoreductase (luciferase family)